jgi:hypothetical protein
MRISVGDESYEFDGEKFLNVELMAIEDATGYTAAEFQGRLERGSMTALTALFWILRKRHKDPTAKFHDVTFSTGELDVDFRTDEEVAQEKALAESASISTETIPEDLSEIPTIITESNSSPDGDSVHGSAIV